MRNLIACDGVVSIGFLDEFKLLPPMEPGSGRRVRLLVTRNMHVMEQLDALGQTVNVI
jgi:hypothetical protein